MQKVKALSRSTEQYTRSRVNDVHKVQRNYDPALHPFEKAREYTRALNAVKMERMFAKPFVAALDGHIDGVYCLAKHPKSLHTVASGSGDGEIRLWDLAEQQCTFHTFAHKGMVKGVSFAGNNILSCSADKTVKLWDANSQEPLMTYDGKTAFNSIDHHRSEKTFATASSAVEIWDEDRSQPTSTLEWGSDTITSVRFNQTETSILAACGSDRSIIIYDLRMNTPVSKVVLQNRSNAIAWNPMEAYHFTAANEDHNAYTFDMRRLQQSINVLKDHVSAVLDVDYAPTGEEIVTGGYDRTLRIYRSREGHSRDVYHTSRMQRIFTVKFSMDARYVLSGSDDGNLRIWKANASEKLGVKDIRERTAIEYSEKLKSRYANLPELRRISRYRHVPKAIKNATNLKKTMLDAERTKEENLRKHSAQGSVPYKAERKKHIIGVQK